jgi:hypothetical protein
MLLVALLDVVDVPLALIELVAEGVAVAVTDGVLVWVPVLDTDGVPV